jgi:hypothetical protein
VPRSSSGDEEQQRLLTKSPFTSPAPSTTKGAGTASQRPRYRPLLNRPPESSGSCSTWSRGHGSRLGRSRSPGSPTT